METGWRVHFNYSNFHHRVLAAWICEMLAVSECV